MEADPIKSREHILLSTILDQAWRKGQDLDLAALIQQIQTPPLSKVGVLDLDSFFPSKDRFALAMQLNNLLAAPGFDRLARRGSAGCRADVAYARRANRGSQFFPSRT